MLFRFILFTVLAYFIFRWLDRTFMPAKKKNPQQRNTNNTTTTQEFSNKKSKSIMKDDVGEYVDFEEVKKDKK